MADVALTPQSRLVFSQELEAELAIEKKQFLAANKLAQLSQINENDKTISKAEVEAEASRHQQVVTKRELYISGLKAEREELLKKVR